MLGVDRSHTSQRTAIDHPHHLPQRRNRPDRQNQNRSGRLPAGPGLYTGSGGRPQNRGPGSPTGGCLIPEVWLQAAAEKQAVAEKEESDA
jgi:hypothetical protein